MNSEKVISVLALDRAFENCQMSTRMTTRTIQNSRLLRVEFTGFPSSSLSLTYRFQDYHACLGPPDASGFGHNQAHHPHDPASGVHDERHAIALRARDLAIDEDILKLAGTR